MKLPWVWFRHLGGVQFNPAAADVQDVTLSVPLDPVGLDPLPGNQDSGVARPQRRQKRKK